MVFAENHENPSPLSQMFTYVMASKFLETRKVGRLIFYILYFSQMYSYTAGYTLLVCYQASSWRQERWENSHFTTAANPM